MRQSVLLLSLLVGAFSLTYGLAFFLALPNMPHVLLQSSQGSFAFGGSYAYHLRISGLFVVCALFRKARESKREKTGSLTLTCTEYRKNWKGGRTVCRVMTIRNQSLWVCCVLVEPFGAGYACDRENSKRCTDAALWVDH